MVVELLLLVLQGYGFWSVSWRRRKWQCAWVFVSLCGAVRVHAGDIELFADRYERGNENRGSNAKPVDMSQLQLTKLSDFGSDDVIGGGFRRRPNYDNLDMVNYKSKPLWKTASTVERLPSRLVKIDPDKMKAFTEGSQVAAQLLSGNPSSSAQVAAGVVREIGDFVGDHASSVYYDEDVDDIYVNRLGLRCDPNTSRFLCTMETTTTTTTTPPGIFQRRRSERLRAEQHVRKQKDEEFYAGLHYNPFKDPPKVDLWEEEEEEKEQEGQEGLEASASQSKPLDATDSSALPFSPARQGSSTSSSATFSSAKRVVQTLAASSAETPPVALPSILARNGSSLFSNSFPARDSSLDSLPATVVAGDTTPHQSVSGGRDSPSRDYSASMAREDSVFSNTGRGAVSFSLPDVAIRSSLPTNRGFSSWSSSSNKNTIETFVPEEMSRTATPPTLPSVESLRQREKKYKQEQRRDIRLKRMYAQPQVTYGGELRRAATNSDYEMRTPTSAEAVFAAREQLSKRKKEYREERQTLREAEEQLKDLQKLMG